MIYGGNGKIWGGNELGTGSRKFGGRAARGGGSITFTVKSLFPTDMVSLSQGAVNQRSAVILSHFHWCSFSDLGGHRQIHGVNPDNASE